MKRNLLLLGIAVLVIGGIFGGIRTYQLADLRFEGKETFLSQEEYSAFKLEVGEEEVNILDIVALSSEPPIVVEFRVSVPRNYDFGYGRCIGTSGQATLFILILMPIAIMISALIPVNKEESQPS